LAAVAGLRFIECLPPPVSRFGGALQSRCQGDSLSSEPHFCGGAPVPTPNHPTIQRNPTVPFAALTSFTGS
jgi:hypothetical protein